MNTVQLPRCSAPQIPTFIRLIEVEALRAKGSMLQWFPLIGLFLGVVSSTFAFFVSGAHDASGALGWQAMYVTGMAAPLLALLAGLVEDREKASRSGGTSFRAVSPYRVRAARILVLIFVSALFHLANFGVSWALTAVEGREGASTLLIAGVFAFLGSVPTVALFSFVARYLPNVMSLIVAMVYQIVGTLLAESSAWVFIPPTWSVRLLLPVLGIHSNAVPLEPGATLVGESPVRALALTTVFAVVAVALAVCAVGPQKKYAGRRQPSSAPQAQPSALTLDVGCNRLDVGRCGFMPRQASDRLITVLSSLNIPLARSGIMWLIMATVALFAVISLVYPAVYVSGTYTFFVLPLGAGILPVLTWKALASPWCLTVLESYRVRSAYLVWHASVLICMAMVVGLCYLLAGGTDVLRLILLWSTTGILMATVSTVLCISKGPGLTIAWSVFITVLAITLGGDVLAESFLWLIALPAWPEIADTPQRFLVASTIEVLLLLVTTRWALSAMRRFERKV